MSSTARPHRRVGEHYAGDLRRTLLDAAARALDDVGIDGLSLRDVARRSGVSHAAPAHHFGDRVGLLTALATEGFELFAEHLTAAVAAAPAGPRGPVDQLPVLARAYAEFAERHPGHFAVMFRPELVRSDDPGYAAASDAAFELLRLHMAACQRAGWRPGADTRALAAAGWALAHGLATLRTHAALARHHPDPSLDGVATLTATLLDG